MTLALVVGVSVGAVAYSHYAQVRDKNVMKEGVERDKERLRMLRRQRKQQEQAAKESAAAEGSTEDA